MQRILLTGLLLWPLAVSALTFQERMEAVEWQVDGNRFECKLVQPILRFGQGEFVRRAGVKPVFRLRSQEALLRQGQAQLLSAPPSWNPRGSNLMLGSVMVAGNERQIETTEEQAGRLLIGLLQGRAPVLRHQTVQGDPVEIRLQPVNFADAYDRYLKCAKELLPVNYEQIKLTAVRFNSGYVLDDKAQAHLDILLEFIAEDPAINHIRLDGHSDNRGDRLANRDISRRRALVVKNYLVAKGFAEDGIEVFFHGERYPVKPNNSDANREENRRVTIQLERHNTAYELTPEQEEEKLDMKGAVPDKG